MVHHDNQRLDRYQPCKVVPAPLPVRQLPEPPVVQNNHYFSNDAENVARLARFELVRFYSALTFGHQPNKITPPTWITSLHDITLMISALKKFRGSYIIGMTVVGAHHPRAKETRCEFPARPFARLIAFAAPNGETYVINTWTTTLTLWKQLCASFIDVKMVVAHVRRTSTAHNDLEPLRRQIHR